MTAIHSADKFLSHYMPWATFVESEIDAVECELDKNGTLRHGSTAAALLLRITHAIAVLGHFKPTHKFVHRQDSSFQPAPNSNIDALFVPADATTLSCTDAAVTAAFKPNVDDREENRDQLVSGAAYIINADPRRMHIFSFSIEDTELRIWLFTRSHSCVSQTVDIAQNPRFLIKMIWAFMAASPNDLGYDPTVRANIDNNGREYFVYQLGERFFKTERSLCKIDMRSITGRGTRVWQVVEVNGFENLNAVSDRRYALKDCWLDASARTERQIQNALFDDIDRASARIQEQLQSSLDVPEFRDFTEADRDWREELQRCMASRSEYQQYFLTIVHDWSGSTTRQVPGDACLEPGLFMLPPATQASADPSRSQHHPWTTTSPRRAFAPKTQYRVVFMELADALHDVDTLGDILAVLPHYLTALMLLFLAGWVHRDISTGNLLYYNGRGLLADLEYAKKFDAQPQKEASADPKTGTAYFMAVEILSQEWVYQKIELDDSGLPVKGNSSEHKKAIIHNYQHDVESFFWVLLWTYLARLEDSRGRLYEGQERHLPRLFQNSMTCPEGRSMALRGPRAFWEGLQQAFPDSLEDVARYFWRMAQDLSEAYTARGYETEKISTYAPVYSNAAAVIKKLQEHFRSHPDHYHGLRSL